MSQLWEENIVGCVEKSLACDQSILQESKTGVQHPRTCRKVVSNDRVGLGLHGTVKSIKGGSVVYPAGEKHHLFFHLRTYLFLFSCFSVSPFSSPCPSSLSSSFFIIELIYSLTIPHIHRIHSGNIPFSFPMSLPPHAILMTFCFSFVIQQM